MSVDHTLHIKSNNGQKSITERPVAGLAIDSAEVITHASQVRVDFIALDVLICSQGKDKYLRIEGVGHLPNLGL